MPSFPESSRLLAPDLSDIPVDRLSSGVMTRIAGPLARSFSTAVLLFVLGVTLFSAYLLWFDVRRELRLAELRSQFVSSVSHELKTPLTAIRMFAETILLDRSPDPERGREYLVTIVNEAERLTRLLNNVLDLAKIEHGQKIYQFAPVTLDDVVNRSARTMEYPLAQQGFRLHVEVDDAVPPAPVDEDALQQAVLNLLTNAMKYSGDNRDITLKLRQHNGEAIIEVTDLGVGIPGEYVGRVAEKFYRVPTAENARIPGTGLGLTLVDHIARAHGGSLHIDSEVGRGTTVGIHLPLKMETA
jgi:signal transduction histidine kinase